MEQSQSLTPFNFHGHELRVKIISGEPWFAITDACKVLEISSVGTATSRLDQDGICLTDTVDSLGRKQEISFANEPNLYRLIFRSDKPQAKEFQDWVYNEVLPSIRKTGSYSIQQQEQPHQLTLPTLAERLSDPVAVNQLLAELQHAQYHQKQTAYHQKQADRYTKRAAQCIVNPQSVLSDDDLEDAPVVDVSTPEGYAARLESEILRQIARFFERKGVGMSITDLQNYMKRYSYVEIKRGCHNLVKDGELEVRRTSHTTRYQLLRQREGKDRL